MTNLLNYQFTMEQSEHTKTGATIFIARLTEKVNKEVFKEVSKAIKTIGGYYSRYVSGFIFSKTPSELNIIDSTVSVTSTKKVAKKKKQAKSLYERVQFTEGNTDSSDYSYHTVGSNYVKGLDTKEIAKLVRKDLKAKFPECKFSVTSTYNTINAKLKSSPYSNTEIEFDNTESLRRHNERIKSENPEITAIIEYAEQMVNSYNFNDSDSMTDYFKKNFYSTVEIDRYDYIQTEQSEAVKQDIENFRKQLEADAKAEEEKREQEFQEMLKREEANKIEYQKQQAEEEKQIESINQNTEVSELEEEKQYFIKSAMFAKLNKNNTLSQYKEEVEKLEYNTQDIKITRELRFTSDDLENFNNLLLTDFDFIAGTGGSYTDDNRINDMEDYYQMTEEERKTVKWINKGIAVYSDNKLQYVIDAQESNYAKYVGLVDEDTETTKTIETIQVLEGEELQKLQEQATTVTKLSNDVLDQEQLKKAYNEEWKAYKRDIKQSLQNNNIRLNKAIIQQVKAEDITVKSALYKVLTEVDKIQDQFQDVDIQQGEVLTIFKTGMLGVTTSHITFDSYQAEEYAQYTDNVKMIFSKKGKRGLYQTNIHDNDILIYKGYVTLPKTLLHDISSQNGFTVESTKFGSYDKQQLDLIIDRLEEENLKPTINTYKPTF